MRTFKHQFVGQMNYADMRNIIYIIHGSVRLHFYERTSIIFPGKAEQTPCGQHIFTGFAGGPGQMRIFRVIGAAFHPMKSGIINPNPEKEAVRCAL